MAIASSWDASPQDSVSASSETLPPRQRLSIPVPGPGDARHGRATNGLSRRRPTVPQLERHPGAYSGHHRGHGQPRWGGGFGWLQLSDDRERRSADGSGDA
jgi:hypothetical protein